MAKQPQSKAHEWKFALAFIALILSIGLSIWMLSIHFVQRQEIYSLRVSINSILSNTNSDNQEGKSEVEENLLQYYIDLSNKADISIDRVITITTIVFGVSTASGLWFAFRAPKDIEKSIEQAEQNISSLENEIEKLESMTTSVNERVNLARTELDKQVEHAQASAANAQSSASAALKNATTVEFELRLHEAREERNPIEKEAKLTRLINIYPDKSMHYFYRANCLSLRKPSEANKDLENAKKNGLPDHLYYNFKAIMSSNQNKFVEAIDYFTKALEANPASGMGFANRGICHCNIGEQFQKSNQLDKSKHEYDLALDDFRSSEEHKENNVKIYIWRAYTYLGLYKVVSPSNDEYLKKYDENKELAYEIDGNYTSAIVRQHGDEKTTREDTPNRQLIVDLYKKMGMLLLSQNSTREAYECFISAYNSLRVLSHAQEDDDSLVFEIVKIITSSSESEIESFSKLTHILLCYEILQKAFDFYSNQSYNDAYSIFYALKALSLSPETRNSAINNLIYMIRRKEVIKDKSLVEILYAEASSESDLFLNINYSLYYYSPSLENNHFAEIVEFIKSKQLDVRSMDDVFKWWSQESIVGKFEHDLVLEVLQELGYTRKEIPN